MYQLPIELWICEIKRATLHPDQLYIFRVDETCPGCIAYLRGEA